MKKYGFTLIELLVTITLLGAIGLIMILSINKVQKNNNKKECLRIVSTFETAAEVYVQTGNTIGTDGVTLTVLKNAGLIEPNIVNPVTNSVFDYTKTVSSTYIYQGGNVCG